MVDQNRALLLAFRTVIAAIAIQLLTPHLLPHGSAVDIPAAHHPVASPVDPSNTSLRFSSGKLTKIVERLEEGREPLLILPETIVFDNKGTMYIMNENAKLVSLTDFEQQKDDGSGDENASKILTAKATEVADLGMGRPLGGKFDKKGCLYYADILLGLARVCNLQSSKPSNVELVASRVQLDDGSWSHIAYADDVDIGPKTGHVYFSDASDINTDRGLDGRWDFLYSSKVECLRGKRTGRLLRYRPETGEVDILATGAAFANGVAVDKDETYVLYTSTFEGAVMKYHLKGKQKGHLERVLDHFTGFLDGIDCSFQKSGPLSCYVAIPSTIPFALSTIFSLPSWLGRPLRSYLMMIPRTWAPKGVHYGGVAEIHPGDENTPASIKRLFQDPDGRDMNMITGVTEYGGKLYLGSLHNNHVGVVSLD